LYFYVGTIDSNNVLKIGLEIEPIRRSGHGSWLNWMEKIIVNKKN